MFKKKPNIKPLSPIRSSDRRKIADQIISELHIEVPKLEEPQDVVDNEVNQSSAAIGIGALRNSLLPEGSQSARFTTTAGPNLKQVSGTVYVGSHPGDELRVLWIKIEDRLVPSVYTLWKHPRLLPLLHTPDVVLRKLQGGADLMTPGLAGPPFPVGATKGAIVAIASLEKPSVPMVVGFCEIDVASLQKVQGAKGHAVKGQHWVGDEIWAWSPSGKSGGDAPEQIDGWDANGDFLDAHVERLAIDDASEKATGGIALDSDNEGQQQREPQNEFVEGEDPERYDRADVQIKDLTTKEIDEIFWRAFLYAAHNHRTTNKSDLNHGVSFPLHQSLVISNFVNPYFPVVHPSQISTLQIKKTSWKNAKKFIKALDKNKIVKAKDRDGGECVILDIDWDNAQVSNFVPYKLPKKDAIGAESGGGGAGKATTASNSSSDTSIGQRLKLINLLRPKTQLSPIFEASNADIKGLYLPSELRPIVEAYIESEDLVSETNKRLVKINPILANAVFDGSSALDNEVLAKGSVPRDALLSRITSSCSPFWILLRNDETRDSSTAKAKAGNAPKVHITLETRSGNKTVTKVSGVEVFHINPQPLAEELQKACAGSASVGQLMGSSPKHPVMEIMVQGPQKDAVVKALEKRGVQRQWVEVADKTKGKKKT